MVSAKELHVAPISSRDARELVKRIHYSGKVAANSQLHFGVFLNGRLEGVMQYGPSTDKRRMLPLVSGTKWNGMLELNRMAFSEKLPRNSESRAISITLKLIKKHYPHIKWVVSFADGCQCGDGTIYRASGFNLVGIKKNVSLLIRPDGKITSTKTFNNSPTRTYEGFKKSDCSPLIGFQLKYIYFLDKGFREKITVPILPFSKINELNAGMYKGEKITRMKKQDSKNPLELGGSVPTHALQIIS